MPSSCPTFARADTTDLQNSRPVCPTGRFGDDDVGRTDVMEHSIPLMEGTRPIRQPPRRLGLEKHKEVECQVADLVQRGMVEPADGTWSSPVVLVCKKDQSWGLCIDRRLNAATGKDAYRLQRQEGGGVPPVQVEFPVLR